MFEKTNCTSVAHYSCIRHLFITGSNKIQPICHYQSQRHLVVSSHCIYQNIHFILMQFKSVTCIKRRTISSFFQPLHFLSCYLSFKTHRSAPGAVKRVCIEGTSETIRMFSGMSLGVIWWRILLPSSGSPEIPVNFSQKTWCHIQKYSCTYISTAWRLVQCLKCKIWRSYIRASLV